MTPTNRNGMLTMTRTPTEKAVPQRESCWGFAASWMATLHMGQAHAVTANAPNTAKTLTIQNITFII